MELRYIGKKAPITLDMKYLSKAYTFKNDEPVEVETEDANRLLSDSPQMFEVVGDKGGAFTLVETPDVLMVDEDEIAVPDDGMSETRESLDELTKAEIGKLVEEKFGIEVNVKKNKEAVISDALAIMAAG